MVGKFDNEDAIGKRVRDWGTDKEYKKLTIRLAKKFVLKFKILSSSAVEGIAVD